MSQSPESMQIAGMDQTVIHLHVQAPAKPPAGQPCNGCGACCATEPCPLGAVMSRRRSGACVALEWSETDARYQCGLMRKAAATGRPALRLVARWIAAGKGCDAELQTFPAPVADAAQELMSQARENRPSPLQEGRERVAG
jgi:hypothetical protein